jgi:hypothetical protein
VAGGALAAVADEMSSQRSAVSGERTRAGRDLHLSFSRSPLTAHRSHTLF